MICRKCGFNTVSAALFSEHVLTHEDVVAAPVAYDSGIVPIKSEPAVPTTTEVKPITTEDFLPKVKPPLPPQASDKAKEKRDSVPAKKPPVKKKPEPTPDPVVPPPIVPDPEPPKEPEPDPVLPPPILPKPPEPIVEPTVEPTIEETQNEEQAKTEAVAEVKAEDSKEA